MSIRCVNAVWQYSRQKGGDLLLLLALADYAWDDGSHAFPSIKKLATKTRTVERTVQYGLQRLLASGELEVMEAGGGRRKATVYRVVITDKHGRNALANGGDHDPDAPEKGAEVAPNRKGATSAPGAKSSPERVQIIRENAGKGATAIAPEPSTTTRQLDPSTTTTTAVAVAGGTKRKKGSPALTHDLERSLDERRIVNVLREIPGFPPDNADETTTRLRELREDFPAVDLLDLAKSLRDGGKIAKPDWGTLRSWAHRKLAFQAEDAARERKREEVVDLAEYRRGTERHDAAAADTEHDPAEIARLNALINAPLVPGVRGRPLAETAD